MPEPTDEQVKAAVESYWSELERGGTMSECIRAALVGGMAVTPHPEARYTDDQEDTEDR